MIRLALLATVALLGGCARERRPPPAPEIVAIKVAAEDMARLRALAAGCGATDLRLQTIGGATLLVAGKGNSVAARDCFFEAAAADYRAHNPIRARIEGLIG